MLMVNQLVGFGVFQQASASTLTVTYKSTILDDTNQTTYSGGSWDGVAIGAADSTRYVVVAAVIRNNADLTSVTIGGVSATKVVSKLSTTETASTHIWWAAVPTGTTANIIVVAPATMSSISASVYTITGSATAAVSTTSNDTASVLTLSLNTVANGCVIAASVSDNSGTATWVGATENYDAVSETVGRSTASADTVTASTPLTLTATVTGSSYENGCAASFTP